ncbi:hypothetical protein [Rhizobium deserti]|uniref:hypothetical protein n=1 Tax=Rhizobium deserti TaxID=2547961 RepID=UPI00138694C2|nr:hypothetical protein [Rhizobium deserti]
MTVSTMAVPTGIAGDLIEITEAPIGTTGGRIALATAVGLIAAAGVVTATMAPAT